MPRQRWQKQDRPQPALSPEGMLSRLLAHIFGAGGLRPFLNSRWPELDGEILWERPTRDVVDQAVRVLKAKGYLDRDFFLALLDEVGDRPQLSRMIRKVARAWVGVDARGLFDGPDDDADDGLDDDEPPAPAPATEQAAPPPPPKPARPWWRFPEEDAAAVLEIYLDPSTLAPDSQPLAAGTAIPCQFRCPALNIEHGGSFVMPWGPAELAELRAALRGQLGVAPGPVGLRRFGLALRAALDGFDGVAGAAATLPGLRLSIRTQRSALLLLPWELLPLHGGPEAHPIALEPGCSVVRKLRTMGLPRKPSVASDAGVLLFAWSDSAGRVPAEQHAAALRGLCEAHKIPFVELAGADLPSLFAKAQALNRAGTPARAMHLLCHGKRVSVDPEVWGLALGTAQKPSTAEPSQLRTLLGNAMGGLELLTIFACSAADGGEDANPLGSVAEAAYYAGVHVVAPSLPLSIAGANLAVDAFYRALFDGASPEAAMRDTVAQLQLASTGDHDWAALTRLEPGQSG